MPKPNDLHHLAIATGDIKTQIEFFSDALGMELVALYWMHGADGCFHGFLKLHDKASVAFVQTPDNHKIPPEIGVTRVIASRLAIVPRLRRMNLAGSRRASRSLSR